MPPCTRSMTTSMVGLPGAGCLWADGVWPNIAVTNTIGMMNFFIIEYSSLVRAFIPFLICVHSH